MTDTSDDEFLGKLNRLMTPEDSATMMNCTLSDSASLTSVLANEIDSEIKFWYKATGKFEEGHGKRVQAVKFCPVDNRLLATAAGNQISVYKLFTMTTVDGIRSAIKSFFSLIDPNLDESFTCLEWMCASPTEEHGCRVLAAGEQAIVRVIEISEGPRQLASLQGHGGPINAMQVVPQDCSLLVTASSDCSCRLWNIPSMQCLVRFTVIESPMWDIVKLDLHSTAPIFLAMAANGRMCVWNRQQLKTGTSDPGPLSANKRTRHDHFPELSTYFTDPVPSDLCWFGDLIICIAGVSISIWSWNREAENRRSNSVGGLSTTGNPLVRLCTLQYMNIEFRCVKADVSTMVLFLTCPNGNLFVWDMLSVGDHGCITQPVVYRNSTAQTGVHCLDLSEHYAVTSSNAGCLVLWEKKALI